MKKILIFLLPIILFSSCQESCKEKVSKMFVIDRIAIDDMIIAQQSIKSSFAQKKYKDVSGFIYDGFGKKRSSLWHYMFDKTKEEDIKLNEVSILGEIRKQILFAKLDLEEKESKAIRVCEYSN
jgi:hypothetical protein